MMRNVLQFARPAAARAYCIPVTTVAREWRCRVDAEPTAEKIEALVADVKTQLPEGASVQRLVCKAEWDYKVLVTLPLAGFGEWKGQGFAPEADFIGKLKSMDGVSNVVAQAYVIDPK